MSYFLKLENPWWENFANSAITDDSFGLSRTRSLVNIINAALVKYDACWYVDHQDGRLQRNGIMFKNEEQAMLFLLKYS